MLTQVAVSLLGGVGRPRVGRTIRGLQSFHIRGKIRGAGRRSGLVRSRVVWSGTLEGAAEQIVGVRHKMTIAEFHPWLPTLQCMHHEKCERRWTLSIVSDSSFESAWSLAQGSSNTSLSCCPMETLRDFENYVVHKWKCTVVHKETML